MVKKEKKKINLCPCVCMHTHVVTTVTSQPAIGNCFLRLPV